MFSQQQQPPQQQQASPQFSQQSNGSLYSSNGLNSVSMATNMGPTSSMGQMGATPMASGPPTGIPSMGPEQVHTHLTHLTHTHTRGAYLCVSLRNIWGEGRV